MGVHNKQIDLDNHLFEELERLNDDELTGDRLKEEVARAKAIANIASQINASRANSLRAVQFADERIDAHLALPEGF